MDNKKKERKHLGVRDFFRGKSGRSFLLFVELLLLIAFFLHPDLYYNGAVENFFDRFYADSLTICGSFWVALVLLTIFPFKPSDKLNRILTILLIPGTPILAFLWLELYNHFQFWAPFWQIPVLYNLLNFLCYCLIYALLLLLFNNVKYASVSMISLTAIVGIVNYALTTFRGMPFIASDIYSVNTALSVANTYQFQIDVQTAEFALLAMVIVALLFKLERKPLFRLPYRILYLLACGAMSFAFVQVYVLSSFLGDMGVDFRVYRPQNKYRFYGTLLTTMRTFGYLHVEVPKEYSKERVEEIIDTFTSSREEAKTEAVLSPDKKPNIIVIMNESFADLLEVGDMKVTEDYIPYYRSLTKNTIKGYTYSSVFGGNTANSEFEFLTGNTMAFLPDNSVPYQLFLRNDVPGLTFTLKDQGYSNPLALHPYFETGYSRYKVYPLMGFQKFYTSDHFSVFSDTVNYHITDYEDYRKITNLYEESRKTEEPFYIFNVTMQNHGSYTGSTLETGDDVQLLGRMSIYPKAEEYLNMLRMSDKALKYLVEYFEHIEDPTIILFFGDHQPDLDESFYDALLNTDMGNLDEEELEQLYKVPFLLWANYDIKEAVVNKCSMNLLSTYLADISGIETTGYMNYLREFRKTIPAINALGYWDNQDHFYTIDDKTSPYYDLIQEYRLLEYNNIFGGENRVNSFFYIDEDGDHTPVDDKN